MFCGVQKKYQKKFRADLVRLEVDEQFLKDEKPRITLFYLSFFIKSAKRTVFKNKRVFRLF